MMSEDGRRRHWLWALEPNEEGLSKRLALFHDDATVLPDLSLSRSRLGKKLLDILVDNKNIFESKGAGRRLIAQNGVSIGDDNKVTVEKVFKHKDLANGDMIFAKVKKILWSNRRME